MSTQATSKFKIDGWDEQPYLDTGDGGKLTRAHVKQTFLGDIHGHGEVEWLMCYRPDDTADFVGHQHLVGRVGERSGSMVIETSGHLRRQRSKGPPEGHPRLWHRRAEKASPGRDNSARRSAASPQ
jgi:Protein of unknown function (DUF3224)